jgi:Family of unknown function (DUF5985)
MGPIVYALGGLTTVLCATLLLRAYVRVRQPLLLFSGLCFAGLAVSNILVFVDLVVVPTVDLYYWRLGTAIAGMGLLLYGLIWDRPCSSPLLLHS